MSVMKATASWFFVLRYVLRYLLSRTGIVSAPVPDFEKIQYVVGQFTGWNRYFRYRGGEHISRDHPAIYFGNHIRYGDPFHVFRGAYLETGGGVQLHAMMRDNVFKGTPLKSPLFDMDDFIETVGIHGINRDNVTLAQMKVFVNLLLDGESFIMFPGRTRSRSGLLMEYRDSFVEPGSISFFLAMAQRKSKEARVSAVPVSRNYNPVRDHTSMIYGPEQFLSADATREEQRAFDFRMVGEMAKLVEISVVQVVSSLVYTVALHHLSKSLSVATLQSWVRAVRDSSAHPWWDKEDEADLDEAVLEALEWLQEFDVIHGERDTVHLNTEKILIAPGLESDYFKQNPVKYLTNQTLHLGEHIEAVQEVVLRHFR